MCSCSNVRLRWHAYSKRCFNSLLAGLADLRLFIVLKHFGATSRYKWTFNLSLHSLEECVFWLWHVTAGCVFHCTLASAPVIPLSKCEHTKAFVASVQSTTNTWEDKCWIESNKHNPGILHWSRYSNLQRDSWFCIWWRRTIKCRVIQTVLPHVS